MALLLFTAYETIYAQFYFVSGYVSSELLILVYLRGRLLVLQFLLVMKLFTHEFRVNCRYTIGFVNLSYL